MCFKETFLRLFCLSTGDWQLTVHQKFTSGRVVVRLMTACGVIEQEVAFFSDSEPGTYLAFGRMDNPDFWYEVSVTRFSPGADWIVSVVTPDDDHYVGLMVGASAGPLWRGVATPTMSVMLLRTVVLIGLDRCPRAIDSFVFMMKRPMFGRSISWMRRDTRDPS